MNKNILKTVGGLLATGVITVASILVGKMTGEGVQGLIDDHEAKRYAKGHETLEKAIELCKEENENSED